MKSALISLFDQVQCGTLANRQWMAKRFLEFAQEEFDIKISWSSFESYIKDGMEREELKKKLFK